MKPLETLSVTGHEQVVFCQDPTAGYRAIIAIHNTRLGPAVGGTRFWNYLTEEEALADALRLSRGMTYKNAAAGLDMGGGKAVILGDNKREDREPIFRAHGRFIDRLGGHFITGEDVGTTMADMDFVHLETRHVAGRRDDPSPWTARGVFRAMSASARRRWGSDDLAGKTVAIQGCGQVGYHLAAELHRAGSRLIVTDIDSVRVSRLCLEFGTRAVDPEAIYDTDAQIFAPCALGGILNDETIPRLKSEMIVGAANNQLLRDDHAGLLESRGILYAPDFVVNAGGVISGAIEILGWTQTQMEQKVEAIYGTLLRVYEIADQECISTQQAAARLAEQRL